NRWRTIYDDRLQRLAQLQPGTRGRSPRDRAALPDTRAPAAPGRLSHNFSRRAHAGRSMSKPHTPTPRTAGGSKVASGSKIANGPGVSKGPAAVNGSVTASEARILNGGPGLQPKITTAVPGPKSR